MLKKDFQFAAPFDKLGKSKFRDTEAEYFGIKSSSPKELDDTVEVLFYNNPSDFAVKLDTAGNDEVMFSLSRMNAVRIASMLSRNFCLRLNAIFV